MGAMEDVNIENQAKSDEPPGMLTIRDLLPRLSISEATLRRLIKNGQVPHMRVGGQLRFDPDIIEEWIKKEHRADAK